MLNFGGLTLTPTTFLSVDHSSPFFSHNRGGVVFDNAVFRFSLQRSIPEVFALNVESNCQKSR